MTVASTPSMASSTGWSIGPIARMVGAGASATERGHRLHVGVGVHLFGKSDVDRVVATGCRAEQRLDLVGMARHVDRPTGQGADESDILRRLVGAPLLARVVAGTDADEDAAHALVAEVELDLLERALDQKGR